jgi:hypothetical protein
MPKIMSPTTVGDVNERTNTRRSSYGKALAIESLTIGALRMDFGCFFLPSTERSWVTKQVKIVLSDSNSVSDIMRSETNTKRLN